ncbi:hypothetical protein niasHS_002632 [Heterodera schachtii]|uniref:Uncharacterized protein n=1 Tax=Heterodera schachtii TaxID=97005 RepID=A0ABD2K1Z8_HETSC
MHFIDAPPPSYDQIAAQTTNAVARDSVGYDLSEKIAEQSTVIRVQELEIGKLRRDLGRMKEQMERMEQREDEGQPGGTGGKMTPIPPKLEQTLVQVVTEEEEERRRKRRGRKCDIISGLVCFVALMAVLGLGIYIVLNKPANTLANNLTTNDQPKMEKEVNSSTVAAPKTAPAEEEEGTIVRHFRIIGKANGDNLCWARAVISPPSSSPSSSSFSSSSSSSSDQIRPNHCFVFRRSLDDRRLFCSFSLGHFVSPSFAAFSQNGQFALPAMRRGKAMILLKNRQRLRTFRKGIDTFHTHTLSIEEATQARAICTEQFSLFRRFGGKRREFAGDGQKKAPMAPQTHWTIEMGKAHKMRTLIN